MACAETVNNNNNGETNVQPQLDIHHTIDGSYGEGGGQLIRNACAYASILQQNICLTKIREGRTPKPGLRPQHLTGLQLLANACGGKVMSAETSADGEYAMDMPVKVGANQVLFLAAPPTSQTQYHDGRIRKRGHCTEIEGDTQTAGSICLLLQAILPYALFSWQSEEFKMILKGGTNATMAPPIDYFQHVFVPTLVRECCSTLPSNCIETNIVTRGFYPKGGGHVEVIVRPPAYNNKAKPWTMSPIRMTERGVVKSIAIHAFAAGTLHASVGSKLGAAAKSQLEEYITASKLSIAISSDVSYYPNAVGGGCGILVVAKTSNGYLLGGSGIGSRKVPFQDTARQATAEIIEIIQSEACVDDYLQDQLIFYMALANGTSEIVVNGVTMHTHTAIWLAEQLCEGVRFEMIKLQSNTNELKNMSEILPRIDSHREGKTKGLHLIRCHGIGLTPDNLRQCF
jgi:RNA 3'-terminal phosphate cyclase (ATP)